MIRLISTICAAWLCVVPAMAAHQSAPSTSAITTTTTSVMTVTEQDNGKTIEVTKGATLVVKLSSNVSTGYSWSVQSDSPLLKLLDSNYKEQKQPAQVAGAPGVQTFQWQATAPGNATLKLEYRRPWEKAQSPAKTFSVNLQIR
jgi:inhibitor of cysteine peptidase